MENRIKITFKFKDREFERDVYFSDEDNFVFIWNNLKHEIQNGLFVEIINELKK